MNNYQNQAVPWIRNLSPYEPGKPIDELERELSITNIVKLASNENPYGPSAVVTQALEDSIRELSRYPDGNGFRLKQALSHRLGFDCNRITLGNGSSELLDIIARVFLAPEAEAVFSEYAFAMYPIVVQTVGAKASVAPALASDSAMPYGHDLQAIRDRVTENTRLVFLANPNNPTGTYLPANDLHGFIRSLPARVMCVVDEAYFEYVEVDDYPDSLQWLDEFPNLIVTRTFSKAYGLAGLRAGYAISSPEVTDLLNRARQPFNLNIPAMAAAEAALSDSVHLQKTLDTNRVGLVQLSDGLQQRGLRVIPSVANFVTVDFRKPSEVVFRKLLREGVIVRPLAGYQLPEHVRVSIGTREENSTFLDALERIGVHD